MTTASRPLSKAEIDRAIKEANVPPTLTVAALAKLFGISAKTIYFWLAERRLEGTYRKRGKHIFFFTLRVFEAIYNGPDWSND